MNVLIACEESQEVCKAFRARGHNAFSCDILECSGGHPEWHINGDVLEILNPTYKQVITYDGMEHWQGIVFYTMDDRRHVINGKWDLIIAFPPCTNLAVSGARHFERKRKDGSQRKSIEFFCQFLKADCEKVVIENPIGIISGKYITKYFPDIAEKYCLPIKPSQIVQPYEYNHNSKKSTCLWEKGVPPLTPTGIVEPELISYTCKSGKRVTFSKHMVQGYKSSERARVRSKTFPGIALAMAEKWG